MYTYITVVLSPPVYTCLAHRRDSWYLGTEEIWKCLTKSPLKYIAALLYITPSVLMHERKISSAQDVSHSLLPLSARWRSLSSFFVLSYLISFVHCLSYLISFDTDYSLVILLHQFWYGLFPCYLILICCDTDDRCSLYRLLPLVSSYSSRAKLVQPGLALLDYPSPFF